MFVFLNQISYMEKQNPEETTNQQQTNKQTKIVNVKNIYIFI